MQLKSSIPKLKYCCLVFVMAIMFSLFSNPIPINAATDVEVEAEHSDGVAVPSNGKWYSTYSKHGGYKGQGVLIYLLERDGGGAVAGTSPKAFPCSNAMRGYELHAQDKYGRYDEVTTWQNSLIPWAEAVTDGKIIRNSNQSNVESIKAWLKTPYDGNSTKGIWLVQTLWGQSIAERFTNEELILVAEPIVGIQFAQRMRGNLLEINHSMSLEIIRSKIMQFKSIIGLSQTTGMSSDLIEYLDTTLAEIDNILYDVGNTMQAIWMTNQLISDLESTNFNINMYEPLGDIYAGTPRMIAAYYDSLVPDQPETIIEANLVWHKSDSGRAYYRRAANAATYVKSPSVVCANANFNLWSPANNVRINHSRANMETYSIGMLAMLAFTSDDDPAQSTWDNISDTPAPPPDESDGQYTIIKYYRDINTTTSVITDKGKYSLSNLTNEILIEDEPIYKVKEWFISSSPHSSMTSITWQVHSTPSGTDTGLQELPSNKKYLHVLLEQGNGTPTSISTNYNLSQSTIARYIKFNSPDAQLTMERLANHTFLWDINAHSDGCGGHLWHCTSSECSNKDYDDCDCNPCSNGNSNVPCTVDHNGTASGLGTHRYSCTQQCASHHWVCGGHTAYCEWGQWDETNLTRGLKVTNLTSYPYVTTTRSDWSIVSLGNGVSYWSDSHTRDTMNAYSKTRNAMNHHTVIHRGETKIVLADWKSSNAAPNGLANLSTI